MINFAIVIKFDEIFKFYTMGDFSKVAFLKLWSTREIGKKVAFKTKNRNVLRFIPFDNFLWI